MILKNWGGVYNSWILFIQLKITSDLIEYSLHVLYPPSHSGRQGSFGTNTKSKCTVEFPEHTELLGNRTKSACEKWEPLG